MSGLPFRSAARARAPAAWEQRQGPPRHRPARNSAGEAGKGIRAAVGGPAAVWMLAFLLVPSTAPAGTTESVWQTKPSFEMRFRHEAVDQDGIDKQARASTAKARLSWMMPAEDGFSAGVEGDFVFVIPPGSNEDFNSTENGRTQYPVVADPTDFDLNQAFLRYRQGELTLTAGRQRIAHFEQRFIGAAGWRQNEQTFDALRVQSAHGAVSFDYSYVMNVNRIFGPGDGAQPGDWKGESHLLRGAVDVAPNHTLGAFAYLLDFENDNGPGNATETYGIDYRGGFGPLSLTGSVARQSDWARNPTAYDAMFYSIEARLNWGATALTAGYEVLGSDRGRAAFRTPLGSLHKFQGWTDKFTATPANGVEDAYVTLATRLGPAAVSWAFHEFRAAKGGADFGREVGMSVRFPMWKRFTALLKFAHYFAEDHATDTTKFWVMLTYRI